MHVRFLLALLLLPTLLVLPQPAAAASPQRCFEETGYCISGPIRDYWERNGGLPVFGYPISPQYNETIEGRWTGPVQWFERDRLEDHSNEGIGVLAGRLGARYLELAGRPWQSAFPGEQNARSGCRYFAETRFNLCQPFLSYWERNGGLERFGYPISPAVTETIPMPVDVDPDGWSGTVQYFERRRIEWHTDLAGTPYEFLLGLLGREVYYAETDSCEVQTRTLQRVWMLYARYMGCPRPYIEQGEGIRMAQQSYDRGLMLWLQGSASEPAKIVVITRAANQRDYTWRLFVDTYLEGDTISYPPGNPPSGRAYPLRGFGKLWATNQLVREQLGWPLSAEQAEQGAVMAFNSGGFIIQRSSLNRVWVLSNDSSARDLPYDR